MKTVIFDIETHGSEEMWNLRPEEMFRLGGYSWEPGNIVLTTDLEEMRHQIRRADLIVGHNIHAFDLTVIFGKYSIEPLEMALADRVWDTWTHATLAYPAPLKFTSRAGREYIVNSPAQAMRWYGLDNLCYQLGLGGKVEDLKALAKEFGGFGEIPVDDERFREYLVGDVEASRELGRALLKLSPRNAYSKREQQDAAINAQNSRNGWRVDRMKADARVQELDRKRDEYMTMLVDKFDMPTDGKAPLRSNAGKESILRALESVGIDEKELPRTKSGNGKPSFGGEGLIAAAEGKGEEAEALAGAVAAIGGMRPLAEGALKYCHADGFVHPGIETMQRSGRKSTTKPGLTIWTSRGAGAVEKSYFVPNGPDEVIVEFDYSQADARIVAALSGDAAFAERFAPDVDAHLLTAWAVWGREEVGEDKNDPKTAAYRNTAKAGGHAWGYRVGPRTLAKTLGVELEEARHLIDTLNGEYRDVVKWQNKVTDYAKKHGYVVNDWGRKMKVDYEREYTQASALFGQSGTREIMTDSLLRIARRDISVIRMLVAQVHDATAWSIPRSRLEEVKRLILEEMETWWGPSDGSGQVVHFPVACGPAASNWQEAGH